MGLDEALAKEELEQRKSAQESFSTQREIQTTGFVSSEIEPVQKPIFFDDDGQEIPFIQPDNVEAPALWREPSSKQIFSAGLIDTLLVLICVAPVTIIATVSKQTQILEPGLMSAILACDLGFWGPLLFFMVC